MSNKQTSSKENLNSAMDDVMDFVEHLKIKVYSPH